MQYTIPDYYHTFACIADSCPDTCCAGWQIMIDDKSLKKYKKLRGPFRRQLHSGINFPSQSFRQQKKRCAFLNGNQLCDIYSSAGKSMLCNTCRRYPRHIEEFEGLREISLSLSCPEAARIILEQTAPVSYQTKEKPTAEESYEDFDWFLFTVLMDSREYLIELLQDRSNPIERRIAKTLAYAHDLQLCINRGELFRVEEVRNQHKKTGYSRSFLDKWSHLTANTQTAYKLMPDMWTAYLPQMEVLSPEWFHYVKKCIITLYERPEDSYQELFTDFCQVYPDWEIDCEQLMIYWIFTYFCGAVYDGDAFSKIKMAVVSTLLIRELDMAHFLLQNHNFTKQDQINLCYRYSRELEHSDENLKTAEKLMRKGSAFAFDKLMKAICRETI